jgi:hypothetical protein
MCCAQNLMTDVVFDWGTWMDSLTDDHCRGCGSPHNPSSVGVATTANGMKGDQHHSHSEKGGYDGDPCMECRQVCLLRQVVC